MKRFFLLGALAWTTCVQAYDFEDLQDIRNFTFSADLLYWKAHQEGLAFTNLPSNVQTTTNFTKTNVVNPGFQWNYGFRLGMGFDPDEQWHVNIYWTHLDSFATGESKLNSLCAPFQGSFPIWSIGNDMLKGDFISNAQLRWKQRMNLIDFVVQREFYCWNQIFFIPEMGLRVALIEQKTQVNYEGGSFFSGIDRNNMHNDFAGAGPRVSLLTSYELGEGFSLFGRAAGSAIYGNFFVDHHEHYFNAERYHGQKKFSRFLWSCDYFAGLQWDTSFCCGLYAVTFRLGWEQLWFFNFNRLSRGQYEFFNGDRDLSFQGITFSTELNF